VGRSLFLGVSDDPNRKGRCLSAPHLGEGSFLFMRISFIAELPNLLVTHVGKGMYLGVNRTSHPKTVEFQGSPILGVLLNLCPHPITQIDEYSA